MDKEKVVERHGVCFGCGKPTGKNCKSCARCRKKKRLKAKANRLGHKSNYYLK